MTEPAGDNLLIFGPPEEVPDLGPPTPADDTPPRKVHTCEACGVELEYNGRGRPPVRCAEHKRQQASTGDNRPRGTRGKKADSEAADLADRLNRSLSKLAIMAAPFDIYDAATIVAMKPPVIEQYQWVMATHDAWRAYLIDAKATGSVVGLILAVAIGASPILAHHGLIPDKIGRVPVGDALKQLPALMTKLNKAADQGEEFLNAYLADMAKKATQEQQAAQERQAS